MRPRFTDRVALGVLTIFVLSITGTARSQMLAPSALHGKKVLFVTGAPEEGETSDDPLVKKHFESMGLTVTLASDTDPATKTDGQDLIVISSTANARALGVSYRDVSIPVFTWNANLYPAMRMTGGQLHRDFDVVEPVQAFARSYSVLYGYGANTQSDIGRAVGLKSQLFGTLYLRPGTATWGRPTVAATVICNFEGDPREAGIFTYERGSSMFASFVAPARRVGFYLGNDNFHFLTAVYGPPAQDPELRDWYIGLKLFDASIRWALSPPPQAPSLDASQLHTALAQSARGKKILFVGRKHTPEGAEADAHIMEHLKAVGFDVTFADQMDPQSMAEGKDLVVISATGSKYKMSNKYRDTNVPVLCLEGLFADTLRLAERNRYVDYGEHGEEKESEDPPEAYLDIVNAWHPMAAGFKPGVVQFIKEPDVLKWATPSPDAVVIATLPNDPAQAAIFGYEKGSTMAGDFVAPARRTLFPLDNPAFDFLTENGLKLFDAVVQWTIGSPGDQQASTATAEDRTVATAH